MANFKKSRLSTLGLSLAAVMMAACGGGGGSGAVILAQPEWASLGMLVEPGQANKIFTFSQCGGPSTSNSIFDVRLTIDAAGNVLVRAARSPGGPQTEIMSLTLAEARYRSLEIYKNTAGTLDSQHSMGTEFADTSKSIVLQYFESGTDREATIGLGDKSYECSAGITAASFAPAAAYLTGESRIAKYFLAGVETVDQAQKYSNGTSYNSKIINGAFHWNNTPGDSLIPSATGGHGSSLNLTTGQLFTSNQYNTTTGLVSPIRRTFNDAITNDNGIYLERFYAAGATVQTGAGGTLQVSKDSRRLSVSSYSSNVIDFSYDLFRQGSELSILPQTEL